MNIKAIVGQLEGLQQNLIGLHGPQQAAATALTALATTLQSTAGAMRPACRVDILEG